MIKTTRFGPDQGQVRKFRVKATGDVGTLLHFGGKSLTATLGGPHVGEQVRCTPLLMESGEVRMYAYDALEPLPTED